MAKFLSNSKSKLSELVKGSQVGEQGLQELEKICEATDKQGYSADRIKIDPSVVRGLGYYTGPVLEAELTFEITDEKFRLPDDECDLDDYKTYEEAELACLRKLIEIGKSENN